MKAILFVAFLILATCKTENKFDIDQGFELGVGIFRGMAKNEEAKCAAAITSGKTDVYKIIEESIAEVKQGKDIMTVIGNAAVKFVAIPNVMTECNILQFPALIQKFTTKEGLKDLFKTCVDRIEDLWEYGQKIVPAAKEQKYDQLGEAIGHILSIALKFNVN